MEVQLRSKLVRPLQCALAVEVGGALRLWAVEPESRRPEAVDQASRPARPGGWDCARACASVDNIEVPSAAEMAARCASSSTR
jgi:hypothetical protein